MSQQAVSADIISSSAVGIFSPKTEGTRHKQLGYTDNEINIFTMSECNCPFSSLKIQQYLN
jgi:hypothetical protein